MRGFRFKPFAEALKKVKKDKDFNSFAKETKEMNMIDFLRIFQATWQEAYDKYEKALKKHD